MNMETLAKKMIEGLKRDEIAYIKNKELVDQIAKQAEVVVDYNEETETFIVELIDAIEDEYVLGYMDEDGYNLIKTTRYISGKEVDQEFKYKTEKGAIKKAKSLNVRWDGNFYEDGQA